MSDILARLGLRNEHLRKPQDKKIVPAQQRGIWREKYTSSKPKIKLRSILLWKQRRQVLVSRNTEERMFVVDSGASMHMLSKKDLRSDEMDTLRRSRKPYDGDDRKMGKCKQTRRHKNTYTISICVSQCNYSKKRQQFYRLVSFAQNTDIHVSGKMVKTHN